MTAKWNNAHKDERKLTTLAYQEIARATRKRRVDFILAQKSGKVCAICGESDTTKLIFHHVNPATKCFTLGEGGRQVTEHAILEEIAKCIILCRGCHTRHHKPRLGKLLKKG